MQIYILIDKQRRSELVGFFWIYTVCKGRVHPGLAGQRLKSMIFFFLVKGGNVKIK